MFLKAPATLVIKSFGTGVSLWFLWNFSEQFLCKTTRTVYSFTYAVLLQMVFLKSFDKISQASGKPPSLRILTDDCFGKLDLFKFNKKKYGSS